MEGTKVQLSKAKRGSGMFLNGSALPRDKEARESRRGTVNCENKGRGKTLDPTPS